MSVFHLRHQGAVIGSLLRLLTSRYHGGALPEAPGPVFEQRIGPIPEGLVEAYQEFCGGDPGCTNLPPHLFPQWSFPLMVQVLRGIDLPLKKVLNQGCSITVNAPLARQEPLNVSSQLTRLEADAYRARLTQRVVTGPRTPSSSPAAGTEHLVAEVHSYFPLKRRPKGERKASGERQSPEGLQEIGRFKGPAGSGFRYACLTGDLNPIHWLRPAAKAAGFRAPILHGFATMALAYECLERETNQSLQRIDVRFTHPFVMPGEARVLLNPAGAVHVLDGEDRLLMVGDVAFRPASGDSAAAVEQG